MAATRVSPFTPVMATQSVPGTTPPGTAGSGPPRTSAALGIDRGSMDTTGTQPSNMRSDRPISPRGNISVISSPEQGQQWTRAGTNSVSQYDGDGTPLNLRASGRTRLTEDVNDTTKLRVGDHRRAIRHGTTSALKRMLRSKEKPVNKFSRLIVDNKPFVVFTTVLTIYALVGEDCKLLFTNKPYDNMFNALTISCLAIFTFEIILSCLGKSDYFLGFFFVLDVVSTVTLLLDLSWVNEIVTGDGEDLDKLRSGRTARVGAKAGRVVRVIRLVRILKLYKAVHDARLERQRPSENPEVDDWGEDEESIKKKKIRENQMVKESRVGKKLSEMTTRRVIILVLTMLLVMPFLQTDSSDQPPLAAFYGADDVLERWKEYNAMLSTDSSFDEKRTRYERALLKYLYYHNWFSGNIGDWVNGDVSSPSDYNSHVFWWGVMSTKDNLDSINWQGMKVRPSTVEAFAQEVRRQNINADLYVYGNMPSEIIPMLSETWRSDCTIRDRDVYRRGVSLLQKEIRDKVSYEVTCPEDLRNYEKLKYYPRVLVASTLDWHFAFYFDLRPLTRLEARYSLWMTIFICVVLCVASLYFSNDANRLVLRPVENMIKRVEIIRNDPLVAVQMADEEFKTEEREKAKMKGKKTKQCMQRCSDGMTCVDKGREAPMETLILEKTIIKLGSLLALGFGEAGANIIGHNLESSDSAGVNAMIPGIRVEAIIGFARIRDFSTATEVLKAKVMTFVNQIAEIVHGVVSEFHGAANKNNGDTFLLIWRISGLNDAMVTRMADMSVIAFAKILGAVHRSPLLASYRGHPALQQRLGTNCRVCLTFGLHAGWAIEGAVGSEFKIDASYLSPNVSIAVSVENATNIYNVPLVITQSVMDMCCESVATKCRRIDQVIIRGSTSPMCLYCLDLDYMCLPVDEDMSRRPLVWNSRWRFKARQYLEAEKCRKLDSEVKTVTMFEQCKDITMMRRRYSIEFLQLFNMGYQNYSEGEWQVARRLLSDTRTMLRVEDGPSTALLRFMDCYRFQAPSNWNGVHPLEQPVS